MILGAFAMVVANAATLLGARWMLGLIRVDRPATNFLLFLLLRLLLISTAVLIAGAAQVLTAVGLGLLGAGALAFLVARGAHRGLTRPDFGSWDRWLVVVVLLIALRLLLQVWFFSPHMDDALSYHLPKIAEWVRAGGFTREMGSDPRSAFPSGFELIETWWVVFLHHDVLIEMAGVEFLVLAGAGAFALAREFGWSVKSASLASLFFVMTPGLHLQATSCLNDGPVTALITATAVLTVARAPQALLLLPIGLGIGVKPTFAYALPGLAVLAWLSKRDPRTALPSWRAVGIVSMAALAVGATWYLRNWVVHGSPIYPMGPEGMKSLLTGTTLQRLGPSFRSLRENVACFLDIRIYDHLLPADAVCSGNFNWGAAAFAVGSPALIAVLRTEGLLRRVAIGLTVSVVSIFTLVELDSWYARFVLFFALLPVLALARLWERHRMIAVLGLVALAGEFLTTCIPGSLPRESLRRMAAESVGARVSIPPPKLPAGNGPVGFFSEDFGPAYLLYGPGYDRRVVYLREKTLDAFLSRVQAEGVTILYVSAPLKVKSPLLAEGERRGRLRPFSDAAWQGYEVLPEK